MGLALLRIINSITSTDVATRKDEYFINPLKQIDMNPTNIRSGWWIYTDYCFVRCYNSKEEALDYIKFQKEKNVLT